MMVVAVGIRSITPGKEAEWEDLWAKMHELARQQKGFRSARLLKSKEHSGKYTLLAEWDTEGAWDRFYESDGMQELTQQSFALFKGAPVQEWHVVVQEIGG
jgi:heme-degrading monooxygenase HmoA